MTSRRLGRWIVSIALVVSFPVSAQLDATFRVAVVHAGPDPAFPQVTFSVGGYWDAPYRSRPWFSRRDDWIGWGTPGFQPPKPATR